MKRRAAHAASRPPTGRLQVVSLRYRPGRDPAPRVTGKGQGRVAERMLELARAHGIPIREDRALVEILAHLDLDQEVPPELYRAVAEILAFVYRLSRPAGATGA